MTWRTHHSFWRAHLWLPYNSVPKVRCRSVKHHIGFGIEGLVCAFQSSSFDLWILREAWWGLAFIYALFCCDVFCLLSGDEMSNMPASLGRMMDGNCQPRMTHGACSKLCLEPASSFALRGGCCRSTSLTNVEFKNDKAGVKTLTARFAGCWLSVL